MSSARRYVVGSQIVTLSAALAVAASVNHASDWERSGLFLLLLLLAVLSEVFPIETRTLRVSGATSALVLAMALLGPGPAVVIGVATTVVDFLVSPRSLDRLLNNLHAWTVFPLAGALLFDAMAPEGAFAVAAAVFVVFLATNLLNFWLIVVPISERFAPLRQTLDIYVPMLPVQVAAAMLTATIAFGFHEVGIAAVALAAVVGFVFVYLVRLNLQATERGEQLAARTTQLAALQVGLITTVLKTLSMRDHMTARHSAAVARYCRAMADALGLDEREQEVAHTAGLLHDIGKFIFPDRILLADRRLSDEDYEIVKRHPEQGAELVRQMEGYEAIADIILAHHERIDGLGYPRGISGTAIPLVSRMIAVADVYDVLTARDTYRKPVSVRDAIAELREVAGTQLDAHLVETFIGLVQRGEVDFRHRDDADFEAELNFERRVADYAEPRTAAVVAA